jgi:hypothetical protein
VALVTLAAGLLVAACNDQPTEAQRKRDHVRCMEFAAGAPPDQAAGAYERCMQGGPGRFTMPGEGSEEGRK